MIAPKDEGRDEIVSKITAALQHRGPDAEGVWNGQRASFGHRRLTVIDLTSGSQPMKSEQEDIE